MRFLYVLAAQATARRVLRWCFGALLWTLFLAFLSSSHVACFLAGRLSAP